MLKLLQSPIRTLIGILTTLSVFSAFGLAEWSHEGIKKRFDVVHSKRNVAIRERNNGLLLRIYSNNVRYNATNLEQYEKPWEERRYGVIQAIQEHDEHPSTLVGLQECLYNQLEDVLYGLNNNESDSSPWAHYGVGRDDGNEAGEFSPILYNTQEWDLLNSTTRWLSSTPLEPSIYPGADTKRIVTITTFRHKATGIAINYFNTHLDQKSSDARVFSVNEIVNYIDNVPNDYPTFLSGDFNSPESDVAYQTANKSLTNSADVAYDKEGENLESFVGFDPNDPHTGQTCDFIFVPKGANANDTQVTVTKHEILDNLYHGFRFSDHRPVFAEINVLGD